MRRSTSRQVKLSVVTDSGFKSSKASLSQIRLDRIAHEQQRAERLASESFPFFVQALP
jgi:hypothetical protein